MKKKLLILCILIATSLIPSFAQETDIRTEKDGFQWQPCREYPLVGARIPDGPVVVPPVFTKVWYSKGFLMAKPVDPGCLGVFDRAGRMVLPPSGYSHIKIFDSFPDKPIVALSMRTGKFGVVKGDGSPLVPFTQEQEITIGGNSRSRYFFLGKQDNSATVFDESGNELIKKGLYHSVKVATVSGRVRLLFTVDGVCCGACDARGNELFRIPGGEEIEPASTGGYRVRVPNAEGTVDENGKWIGKAPRPRSSLDPLAGLESYTLVHAKNGKYGIENKKGQTVVPCLYDRILFYTKPFVCFIVESGFLYGMYSADGKHLLNEDYHGIAVTEEYISILRGGKSGVAKLDGTILLEPQQYLACSYHSKGDLMVVNDSGHWGVLNADGTVCLPTIYENVFWLSNSVSGERYIAPMYNGRIGLHAIDGTEILPPIFDDYKLNILDYGTFILVRSGGVYGLARTNGDFIITPERFEKIYFEDGHIVAKSGEEVYFMDKNGTVLDVKNRNSKRHELIGQADASFEKKDYMGSVSLYSKALNLGEDAITYYNRGVAYYSLERYEDAIRDFNSCIRLHPSQLTEKRANELKADSGRIIAQREKARKQRELEERERIRRENERMEREQRERMEREAMSRRQTISIITGFVLSTINYAISANQPSYQNGATSRSSSSSEESTYRYSDDDVSPSYGAQSTPKQKCGFCGGRGYNVEYSAAYGLADKDYCDECGKTVMSNHYHAKCLRCGGTGER